MSHLHYITKPLKECIELYRELDRKCFPAEMWSGDDELTSLLLAEAQAVIIEMNGTKIGMAVFISDKDADLILEGADEQFVPRIKGAYSYSEAVDPEYQKHGFGKRLLEATKVEVRKRGFESLSAHVRMINGWDFGRSNSLKIDESRVLTNFWEDPRETVRYQIAQV